MFRSLRAKLVISYSAVILFCLLLAGSTFVYLLRDYQRQIKLNQLSDLAVPIAWQVRLLEGAGATQDQMASFLKDRAGEQQIRILLLDQSGTVLVDTSGSMQGQRIQAMTAPQQASGTGEADHVTIFRNDAQGLILIAAPGNVAPSSHSDRFLSRASNYSVVLAVPEKSLTASWLELAPNLSFAGLASLIASVAVAFLLSRSISKPILAITKASEEMARGNYAQNIEVKSRDEVGRLAEAFNHMAQEVDTSHRTLRDFLANVSHDLRTPLTSIQGFSQAMIDGTAKSPEDLTNAAEVINEESDRMRRLVEDLLLLSKIESGQMPMDSARLDLRELLRVCVKRAAPQAQQAGITLSFDASEPALIMGDEGRLEQLFRNLLDNAFKHTPNDGEVTVRLTTLPDVHGDGKTPAPVAPQRCTVSVHNSGSYIPPEDLDRIFERFYQVDKSRTRNGTEGSGLGLAIARQIAHAHEGSISASSGTEAGTTFTVAFPAASSVAPSPRQAGSSSRQAASSNKI